MSCYYVIHDLNLLRPSQTLYYFTGKPVVPSFLGLLHPGLEMQEWPKEATIIGQYAIVKGDNPAILNEMKPKYYYSNLFNYHSEVEGLVASKGPKFEVCSLNEIYLEHIMVLDRNKQVGMLPEMQLLFTNDSFINGFFKTKEDQDAWFSFWEWEGLNVEECFKYDGPRSFQRYNGKGLGKNSHNEPI